MYFNKYLKAKDTRRYNVKSYLFCFQDGKLAILNSNNCFVSLTEEDDIVCQNKTAGLSEFCTIRSIIQKTQDPSKDIPKEEQGSLLDVEVNYV